MFFCVVTVEVEREVGGGGGYWGGERQEAAAGGQVLLSQGSVGSTVLLAFIKKTEYYSSESVDMIYQ